MRFSEKDARMCEKLMRQGYHLKDIRNRLKVDDEYLNELIEIAKCRIRAKNKFTIHNLYFDNYGLRYSTPELIGRYRAERIKGFRIADLSCGVGLQAIFYSFTNKEVLGIDISERRIEYAKKNAAAYRAKNVRFMVGDCFSDKIVSLAKDYDILFSDPARAESEQERDLSTLMPSPLLIIKRYEKDRNYIFDLPPQIQLNKIPSNWEKEFISINGKITRFTTYTGEVKKHARVAVSLPSKEVIWSDDVVVNDKIEIKSSLLSDYIYIVDESVYYAHLLAKLQEMYNIEYLQIGKRRTLATGPESRSPFLRAFLVVCAESNLDKVIQCLKSESFGKVTLRFSVSPEQYWKIRESIERELKGHKKGSLFRIDGMWVGAEECNIT